MVDNEILRQCQKELQRLYGGLNDIPHELANTIANLYYKFLRTKKEFEKSKYIIPSLLEGGDISEKMPQWICDQEKVLAFLPIIPDNVKYLRSLDKKKQPHLYKMWVDFFLDCIKYNIKNAIKKSGLRRMIERNFKTKEVREIPGLIDLINDLDHDSRKTS